MYLIDIYKTLYPKAEEYTFFSSTHGTFSRTYHGLGHKTSIGQFIKTKIIPSILLEHNAMRLEINYKNKQTNNNNEHVEAKQYATKITNGSLKKLKRK